MSADAFVAYFGLRFEILPDEIEGVELRSDPRVVAARRAGLHCHWGPFGVDKDGYLLFIGHEIGVFGAENSTEAMISRREMQELSDRTQRKLEDAGFSGTPNFHLAWEPDF